MLVPLDSLAQSPARMALYNMEDLWLETNPQNVPGTSHEPPELAKKSTTQHGRY